MSRSPKAAFEPRVMRSRDVKRVRGFLMMVLIIIATALPAMCETSLTDAVSSLKSSLVVVACDRVVSGTAQTLGIIGTGFFVNTNGDFVTAAHVYNDLITKGPTAGCIGQIHVPRIQWPTQSFAYTFSGFTFTCVKDDITDIAACHPSSNPFEDRLIKESIKPVVFDLSTQPEGTLIAFTGFPLSSAFPITSQGIVAAYGLDQNKNRLLLVDKIAWSGFSGSPIYLSSGKVVGLILARGTIDPHGDLTKDEIGLSMARTAGYIDAFLQQHGITLGRAAKDNH